MNDTSILDDHHPFHSVCMSCGYAWQAVVQEDCEEMLDCPNCQDMAGVMGD